jgi:hypothetical protein
LYITLHFGLDARRSLLFILKGMSGFRLSSHNVVAVNPDPLPVAPCPMTRPPDVVGPADIITRAASIIGSIANLDSDGARVRAVARVSSVTGSVWPITPIIRSVPRIGPVIFIASTYTETKRKQKEEDEHRPFPYRFRSISGANRPLLRAINDLHFHTIIYGSDRAFARLKLGE